MPRTNQIGLSGGLETQIAGEFSCKRIRAVIADDMPSMLDAMCAILERDGVVEVVGRAQDGCEAVQAVANHNPELVLMDVHMPEMDGLEAARVLSRRFPQIKVVLMSGEESPELREQCRASGADAFFFKLGFAGQYMPLLRRLFSAPGPWVTA